MDKPTSHIRDKDGKPFTDDEAVCYSMYGFAGSASYMSRLVGFMLYEILKNPDLKERLTTEVDQACTGLRDVSDVRSMEQLWVVPSHNETLRFHPVSSQRYALLRRAGLCLRREKGGAGDTGRRYPRFLIEFL